MTNNDTAYEAHMQQVDKILLRTCGVDHMSGEDTATRARFDAGMTPEEHATEILTDWGLMEGDAY